MNNLAEYIKNHADMSGNQIYNNIKGTNLGIRKKVFYEIYRDVRHIEKKPDTDRFIPKKYMDKKPVPTPSEPVPPAVPDHVIEKYEPFYDAVRMLVSRKGKPKNKNSLAFLMYQSNFRKRKYPTAKQVSLAWQFIKSN